MIPYITILFLKFTINFMYVFDASIFTCIDPFYSLKCRLFIYNIKCFYLYQWRSLYTYFYPILLQNNLPHRILCYLKSIKFKYYYVLNQLEKKHLIEINTSLSFNNLAVKTCSDICLYCIPGNYYVCICKIGTGFMIFYCISFWLWVSWLTYMRVKLYSIRFLV